MRLTNTPTQPTNTGTTTACTMPPSSPLPVTATTPLLPSSHSHAPCPSTSPPSHVSAALARPPWAFDLRLQYHLQLGLSCLALVLAIVTILMADSWHVVSSLTLAGIGSVLDVGALLVLAQYGRHQAPTGHGRETRVRKMNSLLPLTVQLLFNASVLGPYRVLAVVLGLTTTTTTTATSGVKIEEAALAALVAMVAFSQLFCSMYFFRLARISRAFDDTTNDQQQQQHQQQQLLSRRGLKDLFRVLGLKPSPSELAELAAIIEAEEEEVEAKVSAAGPSTSSGSSSNSSNSSRGHDTDLTFEDVCRILAHYTEIHASRKRRRHQRRRLEAATAGAGEGSGTQLNLSSPTAAPAAPRSLPKSASEKGKETM